MMTMQNAWTLLFAVSAFLLGTEAAWGNGWFADPALRHILILLQIPLVLLFLYLERRKRGRKDERDAPIPTDTYNEQVEEYNQHVDRYNENG